MTAFFGEEGSITVEIERLTRKATIMISALYKPGLKLPCLDVGFIRRSAM